MFSKSEYSNPNYLAKVVQLSGIRKHSNADRLQCISIDFQNIITGIDAKDGDVYVLFPVETAINSNFLAFTNSFRDKELNRDSEKSGLFEKHGRVRAMNIRGEKSSGYIVPIQDIFDWANVDISDGVPHIGEEFDTVRGEIICRKHIPTNIHVNLPNNRNPLKGTMFERTIGGQIHL